MREIHSKIFLISHFLLTEHWIELYSNRSGVAFWWDMITDPGYLIPRKEKSPSPKNPKFHKYTRDLAKIPGIKRFQILKIPNPRDENSQILKNPQSQWINIPRFLKSIIPGIKKTQIFENTRFRGYKSPDFKKIPKPRDKNPQIFENPHSPAI